MGNETGGFSVSKKLRDNYSHYYDEGESTWRHLGALDKARNVVALCQDHPHEDILEIGAGDGSILSLLASNGFSRSLHALDISESAIDTIRGRNIPGLRYCGQFDGYNIPFGNRQFDLTILSHVLEHAEHPRMLLYEAARVSRKVFVEVPLEDNIRLARDFSFDKVGHINFYSSITIRRLVQTCNLEVQNQIIVNPNRKVYQYRSRNLGFLKFAVKEAALRLAPRLACGIWTYHSALLCHPRGPEGALP